MTNLTPTIQNLSYGPDPEQVLDVYIPASAITNPRAPILVHVHGGGWWGGDKAGWDGVYIDDPATGDGYVEEMFNRGYVIVSINYPLVVECGQPGFPKNTFPTGPDSVREAIRFVRQNALSWGGDPMRVGAFGGSAGGHLSLWAAFAADLGHTGQPDSSRPDFVLFFHTPVDVTKQKLLSPPSRPAQWEFFGKCTLSAFQTVPDSTTQAASPTFTVLTGDVEQKVKTPLIGVYDGDFTKTQLSDFPNPPYQDPHGQVQGVALMHALDGTAYSWADFQMFVKTHLSDDPVGNVDALAAWTDDHALVPTVAFAPDPGVQAQSPFGIEWSFTLPYGTDAQAFLDEVAVDQSQGNLLVAVSTIGPPEDGMSYADLLLQMQANPGFISVATQGNLIRITLAPTPFWSFMNATAVWAAGMVQVAGMEVKRTVKYTKS